MELWQKLGYRSESDYRKAVKNYRERVGQFRASLPFVALAVLTLALFFKFPKEDYLLAVVALFTGLARAVGPSFFPYGGYMFGYLDRTVKERIWSFVLGFFFWMVLLPIHVFAWLLAEMVKNRIRADYPPESDGRSVGTEVGYISRHGRIVIYKDKL